MVTQVLNLTRSGLSDYVVQRATAVILTIYTVWVLGFFLLTPEMTYTILVGFFSSAPMQIASTLAVLSTVAHAWIGMWAIGTDYLLEAHVGSYSTVIRFAYQAACLLALFIYLVWAFRLVWQF